MKKVEKVFKKFEKFEKVEKAFKKLITVFYLKVLLLLDFYDHMILALPKSQVNKNKK